ncbi:MAG: zinc-ribbon domain-containing protein [Clostridia bacterium]|nr:zinc-ribbon domain-containing protein [Clostridia bacterium]
MFDNIGGKIKGFASFLTWVGIIVSVIVGIIYISNDNVGIGILIIAIGSLSSWLSSWLLYGFGELIENSSIIAENTSFNKNITPNHSNAKVPPYSSNSFGSQSQTPSIFSTQQSKKICPHCGATLKPYSKTCEMCGKTIK